ncbi:MAG: translocation/assembly module TamB domain-containing protein, partial [Rhizobiaceae bacterium]
MRLSILAFFALLAAIFSIAAPAQDTSEQADRSYFVGFVEDQLSAPNRQIRIGNIQGVLSSNATIGSITIADREGVWLKITNARIVWTRSALLLGSLDIDTLAADQIDVIRKPLPEEGLPPAESSSFQLPELPLSVTLDQFDVPRITFGEGLFGLKSEIGVTGRLSLISGSLDTALNVRRLDGPGGDLALAATYANASRELKLDLTLNEPANGMVANLLSVDGRPPMALALKGAGPLDALNLNLTLDADQQRVLTGTTMLRRQADGLGFTANLEGPISRLIAPQFRDFFGPNTTLTASGATKDAGGFTLDSLDLASNALTLKASAATTPDGFLSKLALDAQIADANAQKVLLPVAGGETYVDRAGLKLSFGENQSEDWSGNINVTNLATATFGAQAVDVNLGGRAQNLSNPAERYITFNADGGVTGIVAERADVAEALGKQIALDINGEWRAGQPIKLFRGELTGNGLGLQLAGEIAESVFNGTIAIDAASITPFGALAGRDLAGKLDLDARGTVTPIGGGFDLAIDGSGDGLAIGTTALDNLLQGETKLTGRVARGETGLVADKLRIFNEQVEIAADGRYATGEANFTFDTMLSDLKLVSEKAAGRLVARGTAQGQNGLINLTFNADVPQGSLVDKNLTEGRLAFEGAVNQGNLDGQVMGNAFLDGTRVTLTSNVAVAGETKRLSDLAFEAGGLRLTGNVAQDNLGYLDGKLTLRAPDISTAASLALLEATGAVNAEIMLTKPDNKQAVAITGNIADLVVDQTRVGKADIQATVEDLFAVPIANGTMTASDISAGGIDVATASAKAMKQGQTTMFDATAALKNGADLATTGALAPVEGGYTVNLASLDLAQDQLAAKLTQPANITIKGASVALDGVAMDVGGGRVEANGEIADTLDLDVAIRALPLAIANAIKPDLALGGSLDGTAKVGGTRAQPAITFDVKGRELAAAALKQAGLSRLSVDAKGTSSTDRLDVNASVTSPEGLNAKVAGAVPLKGGPMDLAIQLAEFPLATLNAAVPGQNLAGTVTANAKVTGTLEKPAARLTLRGSEVVVTPLRAAGLAPLKVLAEGSFANDVLLLDSGELGGPAGFRMTAKGKVPVKAGQMAVDVDLNSFPLAALNSVAPGQDLAGTITGRAQVGGTLRSPSATFNLDGAGLRAAPLNQAGLAPLQLAADGSFGNNVLTLRSVSANGPQGFSLTASGRVPVSGGGMNISLNGEAPLAIANRFLADRGAQASGTLQLQATVAGSTSDPQIRGMFSTVGAQFVDPESNVRLRDIAVMGTIDRNVVTLRNVSGSLGAGGSISASGTVGITGDLPADIRINLNQARYADGAMVVATVNGALTVSGPLVRDPLLSGNIDVVRAEITVPDSMGGAAMLDVKHIDTPKAVAETLKRAKANDGTPTPTSRPSVVRMNVTVNAPNEIFVRGRGLDAELGGSVTLTGPVTDIQPVGGFRLIRGRLGILGQRITFDEGEVTLVGDLDPYLDFVARSEGDDITVFINVRGRVSDLNITFSSQPELPQDEVLARLIFNRSINELSPLQIAQLAAAATELAGGSNTSLLGSLREATGLDDLDVVTDSQGNAAVRAGRYVQENIYLGVEAGAGGTAKGTVNLDISENLKAKGSVGSDGDSSVGVFFEKEYGVLPSPRVGEGGRA